jgi:hypothetical protein
MKTLIVPFIYGAIFGALLAVCGLKLDNWRFWVLLVGYAILSSAENAIS